MEMSGQLDAPGALIRGKRPQYLFHRRLGGLQRRTGRGGVKNPFLTPVVQPLA